MEDYYLNDRELKIVVLKKLNEIQENTEKQFNKLRNSINKQKDPTTENRTIKRKF